MTELEQLILGHNSLQLDGTIIGPTCCGEKMKDNGGCSDGCCDDYKCEKCGKKIRLTYGD